MIKAENLYNFKGTKFDDGKADKGMEGAFNIIDKRLAIRCKGSDGNFYDWSKNFQAWWNKVGFHSGFYSVAKNFSSSKNSNALKEAIKNSLEIIFSGHSQGCGFILSFMWINREILKGKKISIVLFGCPNIFTRKMRKRFKEYFNINVIYSFRNFWDLVNTVPPWLCGFKETVIKKFSWPFQRHLGYKDAVKSLNLSV